MKSKFILLIFLSHMHAISQSSLNTTIVDKYLKETAILDISDTTIQSLIKSRKWSELDEINRIKSIYNYVRDEIKFGYNTADTIPASSVLKDGYGQCNTKATLLMALLRAVGIPNRIHGFTIDKGLQKGAITGIWYTLSPKSILHSWVEVKTNNQWYFLEGVILDKEYLTALQRKNSIYETTFCGYGVYTDNFQSPEIDWNLNHTFIQKKGINQDFGVFDTPDEFYAKYQQQLNGFKKLVFLNVVRHRMNKNVERIRKGMKQECSLHQKNV